MSVERIDNTRRIITQINNGVDMAIRLMLEDVHREANPITPWRYGNLRSMVTKTMNGPQSGSIIWHAPYAVYQEKGATSIDEYNNSGISVPFKNYTTPGTTAGFAISSVESVMGRAEIYFKQAGIM